MLSFPMLCTFGIMVLLGTIVLRRYVQTNLLFPLSTQALGMAISQFLFVEAILIPTLVMQAVIVGWVLRSKRKQKEASTKKWRLVMTNVGVGIATLIPIIMPIVFYLLFGLSLDLTTVSVWDVLAGMVCFAALPGGGLILYKLSKASKKSDSPDETQPAPATTPG